VSSQRNSFVGVEFGPVLVSPHWYSPVGIDADPVVVRHLVGIRGNGNADGGATGGQPPYFGQLLYGRAGGHHFHPLAISMKFVPRPGWRPEEAAAAGSGAVGMGAHPQRRNLQTR
jgi:hypothetical protein